MQIYTLTENMYQRGEKLFCEVLNRLRTADLTEEDNARASSIPILSYFLTKLLFFPIFQGSSFFSDFLAILPLILVFYSLLLLFHVKTFLKNI